MIEGYCRDCDDLVTSETVFCEQCGSALLVDPNEVGSTGFSFENKVQTAIMNADKPFLSTKQLSNSIGVTKQTVLNKAKEIDGSGPVKIEKIGQSNVFWLNE